MNNSVHDSSGEPENIDPALIAEINSAFAELDTFCVQLYDDPHTNVIGVIASLMGVIDPDTVYGADRADSEDELTDLLRLQAQYLAMKAEREGPATIFEGTLEECEQVVAELTRGGADRDWVRQLAQTDVQFLISKVAAGEIAGVLHVSRDTHPGEIPDEVVEYLAKVMPRPILDVRIAPKH